VSLGFVAFFLFPLDLAVHAKGTHRDALGHE